MNERESFAPPMVARPAPPPPAPASAVPAIVAPPSPPMSRPPTDSFASVTHSTGGGQLLTDRRDPNAAVVAIAWVVTVLTIGYMLPWAVAASRGKSNQAAIGIINFFLGWTFIGWVVALVMACLAHQVAGSATATATLIVSNAAPGQFAATPTVGPGPGWFNAPDGNGRQYWDGVRWTEHRAP